MWYYFPQNVNKRRIRNIKYKDLNVFQNARIERKKTNTKLFQTLLFWAFLLIVTRVGSTAFFTLAGRESYSGLRVSLPEMIENSQFVSNKSHPLKIWIDRHNSIVINDLYVKDIQYFSECIAELKREKTYYKVHLYVDKYSKMEIVSKVIRKLQQENIERFIFVNSSRHLIWY